MKRLVYLLVLLGLSAGAHAQTCYLWTGSPPDASGAAIGQQILAGFTNPAFVYTVGSVSQETATSPSDTTTIVIHYSRIAFPQEGDLPQDPVSATSTTTACPPPPGCDTNAPGVGETFTSTEDVSANNASYCNTVSHCKMQVKSSVGAGGVTVRTVKHTTDACSDEPPMDDGELEDGETCTAVGDGEYCASPTGDGGCGYFNDTYVCLSKVKGDECKVLGDGGRLCGNQTSSTPPVPDSGTPGQVATPDGTLNHQATGTGDGNTYNYFGPSTVAGSSRDPGTDGAAPDGGSPTGGDGEGEGTDIGDPCEGAGCTAELPELEDIGTLSEAMGAFWADLQEVPIISAASDIAPSFGGGTCPDWTTTVALYSADIEIDFTSICSMWTDISTVLGAVCLVMFGLLAFRILFSA